jgi:hypothetical protein
LKPHTFISYLKAIIKNLDDCICQLLDKDIDENIPGVLFFLFSTFLFSRSSPSDYDWDVPGHIPNQRIHFHHEVQDPSLNPARRARAEHEEHLLEDGEAADVCVIEN